jgi:ParB-like chromosome segregation protein Spo0J
MPDLIHPTLEDLRVPIDTVCPYPGNPKTPDLQVVADGLRRNGQYRPITVNRRNGQVLVGGEQWQAAKSLGWEQIAATFVDVDDAEAARIVAANKRTAELASQDDTALVDLLESLTTLDGTGYTETDLDKLRAQLDDESNFGGGGGAGGETEGARLAVGPIKWFLDQQVFDEWAFPIEDRLVDKKAVEAELRRRLGLLRATPPVKPKPLRTLKRSKHSPKVNPGAPLAHYPTLDELQVPVGDLNPYPGNPNQGDVGAIAESLRVNGQFRPIVVNRRGNVILAGNHTWRATTALGWPTIAAVWVEVDDEEAARIVLFDNRWEQLGATDEEALVRLLQGLPSLEGTGYDGDDLDDLLAGLSTFKPDKPAAQPTSTVTVGKWSFVCSRDPFDAWMADLREQVGPADLAAASECQRRLGFHPDAARYIVLPEPA